MPRGQPGYGHLFKIHTILGILTSKYQEKLSMNEKICAFCGNIYFHAYMNGKPVKYGMKIFQL
jgi:hypothetical protein